MWMDWIQSSVIDKNRKRGNNFVFPPNFDPHRKGLEGGGGFLMHFIVK